MWSQEVVLTVKYNAEGTGGPLWVLVILEQKHVKQSVLLLCHNVYLVFISVNKIYVQMFF
jgi:hypothetical protein